VSFDEYGIHIAVLYIHYYALILMVAMLVGAWVTARRARAVGLDENIVWDGLLWAIIPGLIGARLYHVLTPTPASGLSFDYYRLHPLEIFAVWNGGLGIYGAIVGGALGVLAYCIRRKQPVLVWLDLIAPAMALGQAIGRWANFVNNELYGAPTTLPWAIYIPLKNRVPGYEQFSTFHPLFLYESLWNLAAFGALLWIERRFKDRLRSGDLILIYLMSYATIRFLLDFVRLDSNGFGFITTAQLVSLATFFIAGGIFIVRHRLPARERSDAPAQTSNQ